MAKLNIINKKLVLPVYTKFTASQPVISSCYFQNNINSTISNRAYYYNGNNEPKVGDTIFLDINGLEKYRYNLNYILFKEDANNYYYLKIVNSKVVTIELCTKINFKELEMLDQTNYNICSEYIDYPSDLTEDAEIFYHNGEGQFPVIGDNVYNSMIPNDTLNNFTGLFNILNGTYHYLKTNSSGQIIDIVTCNKPQQMPVRSLSLRKVVNFENGDYTQYPCKSSQEDPQNIFYKSEYDVPPTEGTKIYNDINLNTLITESTFNFIKLGDAKAKFLLADSEGKVKYEICQIQLESAPELDIPEIEDPGPITSPENNYYFIGALVESGCRTSLNSRRFYYDKNITNVINGNLPPVGSKIYNHNSLSLESLQKNKIFYLKTEKNIAYHAYTNAEGEYTGIKVCDTEANGTGFEFET